MLNGWNASSQSTLQSNTSQEKLNQGVNGLSRGPLLLFQLDAYILGFKHLQSLYATDEDFAQLYSICQKHPKGDFLV